MRAEHAQLAQRVEEAEDGSAAHAARLAAELATSEATVQTRSLEIAQLTATVDELRDSLRLRERQLALMLTQFEAAKVDAELRSSSGTLEASRLRGVLAEREAQLVALVRELYALAAAERVPGVVAHEARSTVFRRCAVVYEALGEVAFNEDERLHDVVAGATDLDLCQAPTLA